MLELISELCFMILEKLSNYYFSGSVSISGDSDIIPNHIMKVEIKGLELIILGCAMQHNFVGENLG